MGNNLSKFNYSCGNFPGIFPLKRFVPQKWLESRLVEIDLQYFGLFSLIANRAADDFNIIDGSIVVVRLDKANIFDRVHSRMDPSEDGVLPVQPLKNITTV